MLIKLIAAYADNKIDSKESIIIINIKVNVESS